MNKYLKKKRIYDKIYVLTGVLAVILIATGMLEASFENGLPEAQSIIANKASGFDLVNINTASVVELQKLPGIGPVMAERIVECRESRGDFSSAEELVYIRGIGEATLKKLSLRVCI